MSELKPYRIMDLGSILISDDSNIGICIGISNSQTHKWRFAIYIGNGKLLVLYEKERGIDKPLFDKLASIKNISRDTLKNENTFNEKAIDFGELANADDLEFDLYRMNVFEICQRESIKPNGLFEVLKFNLSQIDNLEEGDIVRFERGWYSHHALVTDSSRMIATHRSGEPENAVGPYVASTSLLGIPNEKALVTEDFIIEIAGYRKMNKSNELYDSLHLPRPKEEIVREAKKRIGEKGYSLRTKNCHHFVSECRNGTAYSPEVHGVMNGVLFTTATLLGAAVFSTVLAIGSSFINNSNKNKNKDRELPQ